MSNDKLAGAPQAGADDREVHHHPHQTAKTRDLLENTVDLGKVMTNNQGLVIADDQHSLKAGVRGPTLIEDFMLREKITHFDHERIPERVVHARGAAAHGEFESYEDLSDLTMAAPFTHAGKKTPVFTRFSTVAGNRGSADTPRDVRGFAVRFYTEQGNWDLVGNNIPVFFIQDAIKFPDLIHAAKPEPHIEIPQAATAHDTFWDFVSLTPESAHMLMWIMSDRTLPRTFDQMEGFGVHTFRMVNKEGAARFVKFHWKPVKGAHSMVWDESQELQGRDADFQRRDMAESIEKGNFLEWELGLQIVEDADEHKFDFDLLDSTKLIPEEQVPLRIVGKLTLNRNPDNYFAETEQVAFCTTHIVPGIDFTNDPLLQGRNHSYLDTQLKRVGPNFAELPINRPLVEVRNNQRDGQARTTINKGRVSYFPNSLGGGCPMHDPANAAAYKTYAEKVDGAKIRARSPSFADHFSQATMFWNSMAPWEKQHIVEAFSFELNMVADEGVRNRVMNELLVNIADVLAERVSDQTGIAVKPTGTPENPTPSAPDPAGPLRKKDAGESSPALSQNKDALILKGRKVAILAADGVQPGVVEAIKAAVKAEGGLTGVVGEHRRGVTATDGSTIEVDRPAPNAPSVIYDAVVIAGGVPTPLGKPAAVRFVAEAYKHGKPIAAIDGGAALLQAADIGGTRAGGDPSTAMMGVVIGPTAAAVLPDFVTAMHKHRFHERAFDLAPGAQATKTL